MGIGQSKEEQLYQAAQLGNHALVKSLRHEGTSLEWVDKEGRTPLIVACTRGELYDMVVTLVDLGANLNAYRPGTHGGTPLHHAAKKRLDKTVHFLLSRGADPLAINDAGQTSLDVARLRGHVTTVRLLESHISIFNGVLREVSGPGFLEVLVPQWVTKTVYAVVLPAESNNPRRPPRYELAIYQSSQAAQPRVVIPLAKADVDEPKFNLPDPVTFITDRATKGRYKFLSENEGDKRQMQMFYNACKGIRQFDRSVPTRTIAEEHSAVGITSLLPANPDQDPERIPEDIALAMALSASLEPGVTSTMSMQGSSADHQAWIDAQAEASRNGWESSEAGPSAFQDPSEAHSIEAERTPSSTSSVLVPLQISHETSGSRATSDAERDPPPSAPPLPSEYASSVTGNPHQIHYPRIDTSPIELSMSSANPSKQSAIAKEKSEDKTANVCVVCWDSSAEAVCIPCGHLAGCMECLSEIKSKQWGCPVCRAAIDQVVKVYMV